MKTAYQKLAALCKAANISKTKLAKTLGYKDQQSMARATAKEKVSRNVLLLILKVAPFFDDLQWTICKNEKCEEPLRNDEIENDVCPICGTSL